MQRLGLPSQARQLRSRQAGACDGVLALSTIFLDLVLQLALLPAPSTAIFLPQQGISTGAVMSYCGFHSIERYKTWCESSISAFVASNTSCQQYGMCIPLDGDDAMSCTNSSTCSGWRKGGTPVAACLVLDAAAAAAAANVATVLCDVEIQGPSVFDLPPPSPAAPPPPAGSKAPRDWALWKTMTIIWSILGFAALLVLSVLLIRWCMRRRARAASSSPVTILSDVEKHKIEEEAQAELARGAADATVTLRPTAPDGKPILAYGSSYPSQPPLLTPSITANGTNRLPPNAGDALLQAAANSRAAHNEPPMRTAPVHIPPLSGVALPLPGLPPPGSPQNVTAFGASAAAAAPTSAAAVAMASGAAFSGSQPAAAYAQPAGGTAALPLAPGVGPGHGEAAAAMTAARAGAALVAGGGAAEPAPLVPVVTPAALLPPAAVTLQNPTGPR